MIDVELVLQHLRQQRWEPQKNGDGYWAFCPIHDRRKRDMNLSIKADEHGQGIINCLAGCDPAAILSEIGLSEPSPVNQRPGGPAPASGHQAGNRSATPAQPSQANGSDQFDYATLSREELGIIGARSVKEAPIDWLWKYRFARGEMVLLAGDGGLGKAACSCPSRRLSPGAANGQMERQVPLGDVVIVSAEDSRETTLKPRLMALGGGPGPDRVCDREDYDSDSRTAGDGQPSIAPDSTLLARGLKACSWLQNADR